jgi:hypothetical protein
MANKKTHAIRILNKNKVLEIVVRNGDSESITVQPMMRFEVTTNNPKRYWVDANVIAIENVSVQVWEID